MPPTSSPRRAERLLRISASAAPTPASLPDDELRAFLADVEELVKRVANISDAEVARVRVKVANALNDMRRVASDTADNLRDRARVAVDVTNEYVRGRPWTAVSLAAALGLVVGVGVTAASRRRT